MSIAQPRHSTAANWWALARSEDVTAKKPLAVHCAGYEIVLFRDPQGHARALEDRCPHRRAPLSLGRIRPEGGLQCGYHGWIFDGESGACLQIPNLNADERVPPKHKAEPYAVSESQGLVYVWIAPDKRPPSAPPAALSYEPTSNEASGSLTLSLSHAEFIRAMLDGPEVLLNLPGMRITDNLLGDPRQHDGYWVSERGMMRSGLSFPSRFVRDYPLNLRISLAPHTGLAFIEAYSQDDRLLVSAVLSSAPAARGTTALCWRSRRHPGGGWRAALARLLGKAPLQPMPYVDGTALAKIIEGPSRVLKPTALIHSTAQQQAS
jgi:nitrite reductase/ring-hydroxylating ferredoxin subunit